MTDFYSHMKEYLKNVSFQELTPLMVCCLVVLSLVRPAYSGDDAGCRLITLQEAVETALRSNPAMGISESRHSEAWALSDEIAAQKKLHLQLNAGLTHLSKTPEIATPQEYPSFSLGSEDTWLAKASAEKVIYSGGRLEALVQQASGAAKAREAEKERTRQMVAFQAERAFRLLLAAQDETDTARQIMKAAMEHLVVAENHFEARTAARFDVLRAEVQVEEARQNVTRAESAIQTAHAALLQVLGLEGGNLRAVKPDVTRYVKIPIDELLGQARRGRPEIVAAGWSVQSAAAGIDAARGERMPALSLSADYQTVQPQSPINYNRWSFNALATFPVLDGGLSRAHREKAEARHLQAISAREEIVLRIESEVRQAHAKVEAAFAEVGVAEKRIEQAEELMRLANVRYEGGVGTATEIADSLANLSRTRQDLNRALAQQGIAEAELNLAVGIPVHGLGQNIKEEE